MGVSYAYGVQMQCCQENQISLAIMSRENTPTALARNTMYAAYKGLVRAKPGWEFDSEHYYLTYDNPGVYSCWQKLVWFDIDGKAREVLEQIPRITNEDYTKRFSQS